MSFLVHIYYKNVNSSLFILSINITEPTVRLMTRGPTSFASRLLKQEHNGIGQLQRSKLTCIAGYTGPHLEHLVCSTLTQRPWWATNCPVRPTRPSTAAVMEMQLNGNATNTLASIKMMLIFPYLMWKQGRVDLEKVREGETIECKCSSFSYMLIPQH